MLDTKYLTEEERARYTAMQQMFESGGWAEVVRNATKQMDQIRKDFERFNSMEQLKYAQGTMDTLRGIVQYSKIIEETYSAIIESRREDEIEIEESFGANE